MIERDIRKDFPILDSGVIFLDSAATSLTPEPVVNAVNEYYHKFNANIERGVYNLSQEASEKYDHAHKQVADFLGVKKNEIVFTKNTTEAINLVAHALLFKEGDKIITTLIEHHSNYLPWLEVAKKYHLELVRIKPNQEGKFDIKDFEREIDNNTKLVAINHVSNVLGIVSPVAEIVEIAKKHNALVLADGAQAAPHIPLNLKDLDVDFYATSGHKMLGPTGTGILYIHSRNFDWFFSSFVGGGVIKDVDIDDYTLTDGYERFEAGTPNIAGGIGVGEAASYLSSFGMNNVLEHERKLTDALLEGMGEIDKVKIYGPLNPEQRIGVVSFNLGDMLPHKLAKILSDKYNIAVRSGKHCAHPLHKYIIDAPSGTVRASLYIYNNQQDVDRFISALREISKGL